MCWALFVDPNCYAKTFPLILQYNKLCIMLRAMNVKDIKVWMHKIMLFLTKCIMYAQERRASEKGGRVVKKNFFFIISIYVLTIISVLNLFWTKTNKKLLQYFLNKKISPKCFHSYLHIKRSKCKWNLESSVENLKKFNLAEQAELTFYNSEEGRKWLCTEPNVIMIIE